MVSWRTRENCKVGLDFYDYLLKTRRIVEDKEDLRRIYNTEFRKTTNNGPCFGSVLYALRTFRKIYPGRNGQVRFNLQNQWSRPQRRQSPVGHIQAVDSAGDRRKLVRDLMRNLKTQRENKNGIVIFSDHQFNNGKVPFDVELNSEYTVSLYIKNTGPKTVHFTYYTALHWLQYFSLEDEHKVTKANPLSLNPGDCYLIKVKFNCSSVGFYSETLLFEFKPELQSSTTFHIVRFIEAHCMTTLGKELAPTAPYRPQPLPAWTPKSRCTIVDGQRPEGDSVKEEGVKKVRLEAYPIPKDINNLIKALEQPALYSDPRKAVLEAHWCRKNYAEKFKLLLYLEEVRMEVDIRKYNIPNEEQTEAKMEIDPFNKKLLILTVPGVAENRPSVLRGDELLVYPVGETEKKYRGYVHRVELDCVKLGFNPKLLDIFVKGMKFNIEFTVNRLTLRIQHRAAEFAVKHGLAPVLFPAAHSSSSPQLSNLKLFDRKLEENPEQYRAVQHIVAGSSKPAPYLVFGPPGTGKTVTVVEAIKQIERSQANCHVLACAPTNNAADLLCIKILEHVPVTKVFRIYAKYYNPEDVPQLLKECSNMAEGKYEDPTKGKVMKYKIVISTLLTSSRIMTENVPPGHFTHVFVDEAGHAVETECILPLSGLLSPESGHVVLAGDPKQLGPIVRSPFALRFGMGKSLLERLMTKFPLYQKDNGVFDNRFVTKLLQNYRSHPDILAIPNELFYDNEVQPFADKALRNSYCSWEHLPKMGFPIIFHGVTGLDQRESSSPSFFNTAEVEVLMDYVNKLLQTQGKKGHSTLSPKDIGIIAPYRKQVQKIRKALQKVEKDFKYKDLSGLKIGSVEEFQGQERRVILVSTVRSSPEYAEMDKTFKLGFVKNDKRFNVATTRAKALLIIVGNPVLLKSDPIWARFLKYCKDKGGYRGYDPEDEEDIVIGLNGLLLDIGLSEAECVQQGPYPE